MTSLNAWLQSQSFILSSLRMELKQCLSGSLHTLHVHHLQQSNTRHLFIAIPFLADSDAVESVPQRKRGCCWKTFHTDVNGKWYKPHKAGPVTGFLLVVGWILFLVFFGWIVGLALLLVLMMVACASLYNFICTGKCAVEEAEEGEGDYIGAPDPPGQTHPPSS